jgi:3-hydroxyacyl-CoA dehydrogenase
MTAVTVTRQNAIAIIAFGLPPVNSLGAVTRRELVAAFDELDADSAVAAVVLTGLNGLFSAGADIKEFGSNGAVASPNLREVITILEGMTKPVVAAIEGACLGGGLELALGCHYRIALASAKLGLPEVKLGLMPGAGGTQRLPRLVGVEAALNLILSGEPAPAKVFHGTPLLDAVVASDLLNAAVALAAEKAKDPVKNQLPKASARAIREPNAEALFIFARNMIKAGFPNFPAPLKCIDAIEASTKGTFDEGLAVERHLFEELMAGSVSRALRHAFFAERAASKIPGIKASPTKRDIKLVGIVGAGTMGSGIAINFLNAGIPVILLELNQESLDRGLAKIKDIYASQVKKGRLSQEGAAAKAQLLTPSLDFSSLANADLIIEAVFEDMSAKERVFKSLDAVAKQGAILATNTSTLDVNKIAGFTNRPEDVLGTHFFSPANVMKLLEVVRGTATSPSVLITVMDLAKVLRKTAVVSGVCDGFIGNRMLEQYVRQALFMLDEGASPESIDAAAEQFGFAMGPFRVGDLAGNDIGWHIRKRRYIERPQTKYSQIADRLCELGRFGQKTNAGWYDYKSGDRSAYSSPVVAQLLTDYRREKGLSARSIGATEIVDRLVFALVNEAAKILEEGIALRASDIDLVYLTGYGFPVWRGGPMCYADEVGLYAVVRRMRELGRSAYGDSDFWTPAPLLQRLADQDSLFNAPGVSS